MLFNVDCDCLCVQPQNDTPWITRQLLASNAAKMFLQSGAFSSTIKTSFDATSIDNQGHGISWDGVNSPWCGNQGKKVYLQSGQFSSTVKDSEPVVPIVGSIATLRDVSWDGANTPFTTSTAPSFPAKLFLLKGQFDGFLVTSQDVSSVDINPSGISYSEGDTPWCGASGIKLYLQSGQFSSTIKTSLAVPSRQRPEGISWDGNDSLWCTAGVPDKLYLQSGQFSSVIKNSINVGLFTNATGVTGINTVALEVG